MLNLLNKLCFVCLLIYPTYWKKCFPSHHNTSWRTRCQKIEQWNFHLKGCRGDVLINGKPAYSQSSNIWCLGSSLGSSVLSCLLPLPLKMRFWLHYRPEDHSSTILFEKSKSHSEYLEVMTTQYLCLSSSSSSSSSSSPLSIQYAFLPLSHS